MGVLPSGYFLLRSLAYASALGLLSMGLSLTYLTTKVPNFAHATIAMVGSVVMLFLVDRWFYADPGWSLFVVGPLLGGLAAAVFSVAMYLLVLKPLADRGNGVIGLMIATFAVDIFLVNLLTLILNTSHGVHYAKLIGANIQDKQPFIQLAHSRVGGYVVALPLVAAALALAFHLFLTRTKFGVAMRASIENPGLASVMGVNVNLVYTVSWAISGFLAGAAGAFMPYAFRAVDPSVSAQVIVSVFAGSIVGGLMSVYWGLIGGLIVGLAEKIGTVLVQNTYNALFHANVSLSNYEKVMSLGLVIVTLLFAPQGLAGVDWGRLAARLRLPAWPRGER